MLLGDLLLGLSEEGDKCLSNLCIHIPIFDRLRFIFSQSTFQHGIPWNPKWLFKKFAAIEAHFLFFALSSKHVDKMHSGMSVPWKYYTEEILCPGTSPLLHLFISPLPKSLTTTDLFLILVFFFFFAFSTMSHFWNHIICSLLRVVSFIQQYNFKSHPSFFFWTAW